MSIGPAGAKTLLSNMVSHLLLRVALTIKVNCITS